ncbi:MAG: hydroxymethylbilane synthase [Verrucomicrobiota bacterium]|nr:hydroxymethylbilane synthase [Verrucomicrobiota bacterium]
MPRTIYIATRGSALALAQANWVRTQLSEFFPGQHFELKIIRTTGDQLQTASLSNPREQSSKGLFTKELENALLAKEADIAVHSLKDLPTELPEGLLLGAIPPREDVRDLLIFRREGGMLRGYSNQATLKHFATGAVIATSSTRRQAQVLASRPDLHCVPVRGNVGTRLNKLATLPDFDGMLLAAAGINRLGFKIATDGTLSGEGVPEGLLAKLLSIEEMLPCVGQAALGIEIRANDPQIQSIVNRLNDHSTALCVRAERAFLRTMGGGCLSPIAACARFDHPSIHIDVLFFEGTNAFRKSGSGPSDYPEALGERIALELKSCSISKAN